MKQNSLQYLLEKYREGTLNDEERVELERLTHKDEVMAAASHRVRGIIRRRVSLAVATVLVAGVGVVAVLPREVQGPLMAEAKEIPAPVVEMQHEVSPSEKEVVSEEPTRESQRAVPMQARKADRPVSTLHRQAKSKVTDPVVVCNNQCEADSVISDIRKFLSV